ncbi:type II toxin-antitoxin system VapC family toxin [Nocardia sp. CS682]|uniref:type II toxin-antitoxin system VapC family toxin n=1 Tax=Nocardia sp. CS682 TaxID=1047172 RepID=UPI001074E491|nr:PIN domain-containing protein [Nocardia sp. CS682]QBS42364.1 VapC toxin family PIN domain ribonuclease [Nocardia sp. CS682]
MIVCDTGPLLAIANSKDSEHQSCTTALIDEPGPLIVPATIVTEVCYMLAKHGPQAEAQFLRALAAEELQVEPLTSSDFGRMAELVIQYGSFPLGAADASVVAVAERLGVSTVATLDHRHFRQVVPKHCAAFTLIPGEEQLARHQRR